MPGCHAIQDELTAWIDGELSDRSREQTRLHLNACPSCAEAADRLRAAIATQRRLLTQVAAADVDPAALRWRLQRALAAEIEREEQRASGWRMVRTLAFAGAGVAAVAVLLLSVAGGPTAVLIPLGVEQPPAAVTRAPELFREYAIIQHLDALENFDTVESTPLDDEQASQKG